MVGLTDRSRTYWLWINRPSYLPRQESIVRSTEVGPKQGSSECNSLDDSSLTLIIHDFRREKQTIEEKRRIQNAHAKPMQNKKNQDEQEAPCYRMSRDIETVPDLWRE